MSLFKRKEKTEKKEESCCCGGETTGTAEADAACCCGGDCDTETGGSGKGSDSCCCGGDCSEEDFEKAQASRSEGARIKILGSGCAKCQSLEAATRAALAEMQQDIPLDHVTDFAAIAAYGVMTTPALVIDEKVVSYGKVLKKDEVRKILEKVL